MLNCKEVTEMCSQEMERSLLLQERLSLRMHLVMCSGCTNFRKQMQALRMTMQHYASGAAVSTADDPAGER
ncbi:MAG: hypothetical protein WKG52_17770 [Variovorax sp.]